MPMDNNQDLKKMVNNLAKVINQTLTDSSVVRQAVEAIRENGYGVDLSLAASIGIYKEEFAAISHSESEVVEEIKFELNQADMDFLQSLKLSLPED